MQFHSLKIKSIRKETQDTVVISFDLTNEQRTIFTYKSGQYLTLKKIIDGKEERRSYSICSYENEDLSIAVKQVPNGVFSTYANEKLIVGEQIESMAPMGNFTLDINPTNAKHYVGVALGSGITPIISMIKDVMQNEKKSIFTLFYGSRNENEIIFRNELNALKSIYGERFTLVHILSQQANEDKIVEGRISEEKFLALLQRYPLAANAHHYMICGPVGVIEMCSQTLQNKGINKSRIQFELFSTVELLTNAEASTSENVLSNVTVLLDGDEYNFDLQTNGQNILDAAIDAGADAPYACKGAVCCTCKAKVIEGKVDMRMNYALTDNEVQQGYILTCQSHPITNRVVIEF